MQIWVDADACPGEIKELLYRTEKSLIEQALQKPEADAVSETKLVRSKQNGRVFSFLFVISSC